MNDGTLREPHVVVVDLSCPVTFNTGTGESEYVSFHIFHAHFGKSTEKFTKQNCLNTRHKNYQKVSNS